MRVSRGIAAILTALPLAACAVAGPEFDRAMDDAPAVACTEPAALMIKAPDERSWIPYGAASIPAGTEVLALPGAAGNFTHVVLVGDGGAAGAMSVLVPDAFGRGDRGRTLRWHEARRRWILPNIGTAVHNPAGVRIHVLEGEVRIDRVCFRSYLRTRTPPPAEEGAANPAPAEH